MAAIGCTVRAFDPASTQPESVKHKNIHFYKIGISHKTGKQKVRSYSQYLKSDLNTTLNKTKTNFSPTAA